MRILITNDDGITAPGLKILETIAKTLAGPQGEVWVVAPAFEQSGVGHCISLTGPLLITQLGPQRFSVEGSPADCVLAGLHEVLKDTPPDLILSGVNRGNNSAENALYSGPDNVNLENSFDAAEQYGAEIVQRILDNDQIGDDYRLFYNVNFPPVAAKAVKGTKVTTQGRRTDTRFSVEGYDSPTGRRFLWVKGGGQHLPTAEGSDAHANLDGYISVTPMRADLTAHAMLDPLKVIQ
jgi:5'-nucleotidase